MALTMPDFMGEQENLKFGSDVDSDVRAQRSRATTLSVKARAMTEPK